MFQTFRFRAANGFWALVIGGLLVTACKNDPKPDVLSSQFSVVQVTVSNKKIIKISLPAERPRNMAIITPSKAFYVVHAPDEGIVLWSMLNKDGQDLHLELPLSSIMGSLLQREDKTVSPIFTAPGIYTVYLANNLETEPENDYSFSKDFVFK